MASYRKEVLPKNVQDLLKDCRIPEKFMEKGRKIGWGNFGEVYEGTLTDPHDPSIRRNVAIKTITDGTTQELIKFLQEAAIMKGFDNYNVLSLLGVVMKENCPYILLPLMDLGDLRKYVSANRQLPDKQLMRMTNQVASGMKFLHERNVVHRDLAARNCLVNSAGCVKVADFGLTRDTAVKDYYRTKSKELPWKWMALESLETLRFDAKSDVWSFGVLMWETMSYGGTPYSGIANEEMLQYLKLGNRLQQPESCPDDFYEFMCRCWRKDPKARPTFGYLYMHIQHMYVLLPTQHSMLREFGRKEKS